MPQIQLKSQIQLKFNQAGFEEIITSSGVASVVEQAAQDIKQRADANLAASSYAEKGEEHAISTHVGRAYGKNRALANVTTSGAACSTAEAVDKTLSSAVMR